MTIAKNLAPGPVLTDHCYRDGWVEQFFAALEAASSWLAITPPGEYVATHAPLGRADLPTASYSEMMEWVLPTEARNAYHAISEQFEGRPEVFAVSSRRPLARLFQQNIPSRTCSTKKCCTFPDSFAALNLAALARATREIRRRANTSAARTVQRRLLARRLRRPVCSSSSYRAVARTGSR